MNINEDKSGKRQPTKNFRIKIYCRVMLSLRNGEVKYTMTKKRTLVLLGQG